MSNNHRGRENTQVGQWHIKLRQFCRNLTA
jgi:hypothetical protein